MRRIRFLWVALFAAVAMAIVVATPVVFAGIAVTGLD
jgi:hypothetical protein